MNKIALLVMKTVMHECKAECNAKLLSSDGFLLVQRQFMFVGRRVCVGVFMVRLQMDHLLAIFYEAGSIQTYFRPFKLLVGRCTKCGRLYREIADWPPVSHFEGRRANKING